MRRDRRRGLARVPARTGAMLVLLMVCGLAAAEDPTTAFPDDGAWSFQVENDLFAKGQTDRYYSNGLRVVRSGAMQSLNKANDGSWSSRSAHWIGDLLCRWSRCNHDEAWVAADFHGGQNMYTPQELRRPTPYPYDRAYAGWLYLGQRIHLADQPDERGEASRLQSLDIIVGVVGPAAGAGKVQRAWHRLIDATRPEGWGNQLRNEPTLQVSYTRMHRLGLATHVDTLPYGRIVAGNVFSHVAIGTHVRVGTGLGGFASFDPAPAAITTMMRRRASDRQAQPLAASSRGLGDWHVFAAVEGRAVARNIFIDGNTFRDFPDPSYISRRAFVGDLSMGFSVRFLDRWRLTYGQVWRSREFSLDQQPPRGTAPTSDVQRYGVIQLQYEN
ncbi:lipid A deacylase LpxR family protein [Mitsuaria sp. GD03876]|uniref:lipid A deacylase LpxR family protein n=1 Tax=Mitsuaria sp. GD03876 TaxID=2975399 RepID=UPI00244CF39B|nr:lipid A deacylase LpxR family protein [Mitsuaria sp. GD03876]MDH0865000.1 lipid A deacylase LpxR family protein [Mitsuaria sp. GD03876]